MADFWQPTAQMFSSMFEKPKMSQKLLEKPPFKYLFDIVTETTKTTGFGKGLYSAEELDPAFYDSKERKITYLKKIIDVTQMMTKEQLAAKPSKIVAGLEPENTNFMLQALYKVAISGQNSDSCVRKVIAVDGGGSLPAEAAQKPAQQKVEAKPQEKPKEQPPQAQQQAKPKPQEQAPQQQQAQQQQQKPKPQEQPKEQPREQPKELKKPEPQVQAQPQAQPSQQQEGRPSTAKRRPPKLASNQVEEHSKKGQGTANVISDKQDDNFDDDIQTETPVQNNAQTTNLNSEQQGKFIRNATKQAEAAAPENNNEEAAAQEGESKIKLGRLGGKKKQGFDKVLNKDSVKAQVAQNMGTSQVSDTVVLQTLVQSICQSANPLGKSLEFIQDDIESMNHELSQWRKIYETSKNKMVDMNKQTEDAQQPLFDKIAEVEESVREKKIKIQNLKAQTIKNKFTIESLLKSVVIQK